VTIVGAARRGTGSNEEQCEAYFLEKCECVRRILFIDEFRYPLAKSGSLPDYIQLTTDERFTEPSTVPS